MIKKEIKNFAFSAGEYESIECKVPATAYSILLDEGIIQDPFFEMNLENIKPKVPTFGVFKTFFEFSKAEVSKKHVYLKICGVLAKAEVFFNDCSYGFVSNPNRKYVFDITDRIKEGENILEIKCSEPILRKENFKSNGEISSEYDVAPVLDDFGILETPVIVMTDSAFINDVYISQEHSDGKVNVIVNAQTLGSNDDIRVVASLTTSSGKIYFGGVTSDGVKISVSDPELWWPKGFGTPFLYKLSVTLYHGGEAVDTYEKKIGLRKIELESDVHETPAVVVNGVKIFSVGASYVRENPIIPKISKESTEKILDAVVKRNMNTVTVFDEGINFPESFYDMCDEKGILVWQSLTVPYIAPPSASVFAAGLTDSLIDTIKSLCIHSSVGLMFLTFARPDSEIMRLYPESIEEFRSVTMRLLTPAIEKYAKDTVFLSEFESIFAHDERYLCSKDASILNKYYSIPEENTMNAFLSDENYNVLSEAAEYHIADSNFFNEMLVNTAKHVKFPYGMSELAYATQVASAIELAKSVKKARESDTPSMSSVLRQLNDGWPSVSSSLIDFYQREKAAMYSALSFSSSVTVNVATFKESAKFTIINGSKKACSLRLVYALYDTSNKCFTEIRKNIEIEPLSTLYVAEEDFSKYMEGDKGKYYLIYQLYDYNGIVDKGCEIFVPLKHFKFNNPEIDAEITGSAKKFIIKLTSTSFVCAVSVSFKDIDAKFSSNFVSILPKEPTVISVELDEVNVVEKLTNNLIIQTPYSIG